MTSVALKGLVIVNSERVSQEHLTLYVATQTKNATMPNSARMTVAKRDTATSSTLTAMTALSAQAMSVAKATA
tara:strand:+ start:309 stop:527 length:219 start_codon:yes stop_codon:yes gene_type:complete